MIQEIITLIIVGIAITYTLYSMLRFFVPAKKESASCSSGSCNCKISASQKKKTAATIPENPTHHIPSISTQKTA